MEKIVDYFGKAQRVVCWHVQWLKLQGAQVPWQQPFIKLRQKNMVDLNIRALQLPNSRCFQQTSAEKLSKIDWKWHSFELQNLVISSASRWSWNIPCKWFWLSFSIPFITIEVGKRSGAAKYLRSFCFFKTSPPLPSHIWAAFNSAGYEVGNDAFAWQLTCIDMALVQVAWPIYVQTLEGKRQQWIVSDIRFVRYLHCMLLHSEKL